MNYASFLRVIVQLVQVNILVFRVRHINLSHEKRNYAKVLTQLNSSFVKFRI